MIRRHLPVAIVVASVLFATNLGFARVLEHPTLYRLEPGSTFQRGCFPPCMCPIMEAVPITGTFRLELVAVGDVFDFYEVRGIRWKVRRSNADDLWITGSGTYKVSTVADLQEMNLELFVGTEPLTTYASDSVPGGASFPRIDVPISINGGFCFDTVLELRARPARRVHVDRNSIAWDAQNEEASITYDVVQGDLNVLRASGGAFDVATSACLADSVTVSQIPFVAPPESGRGFWFLQRESGGSYDDGDAAQIGSSDPGIALSPAPCP